MNAELLKQILPIVEKTNEGILKGVEVAQEQFPDLIRQVYAWELAVGVIGLSIGIILLVYTLTWGVKLTQKYWEESYQMSTFFSVFTGITSIPIILINLMKITKILIAPKLFLIEYISQLIK